MDKLSQDTYICSQCERICDMQEVPDHQHLEFWGQPVTLTQYEYLSDCCKADAYTTEEWLENKWGDPSNLNYYELVEHGFLDEE